MKRKSLIPVSGPREALQTPFAALDLPDLPDGPPDPPSTPPPSPRTARIVLRKEKARRGGKTVVVASGFAPEFPDRAIEELARKVRKHLGCGGTIEGREIIWQGEDPEKFRNCLALFHPPSP